MSNLQMLLNRLEHLHPAGEDQWRAKCPVHGGENRSTLSIKACGDGRILLRCHAHQCPPLEILQVCGMELSDIMPERITHHATPQEKQKWREAALHRDWEEARQIILTAARVIWIAGAEVEAGRPLNELDSKRLNRAMDELDTQGRMIHG